MNVKTSDPLGYLGPRGTFSHEALLTLCPDAVDPLPMRTVTVALDAVRSGEVSAALVPIENSVEGAVSATLDELAAAGDLQIEAEVAVPVRFVLATRPGTQRVSAIVTHPHAAAQCRGWLASAYPDVDVVPAASTAAAAVSVARGEYDAAVCAHRAAAEYHLDVAADDIGDNPEATTRFVLVRQPGPPPPPSGADKTTLEIFMREDHPGALLEILTEFAVRGVNLTRIESRPTKTSLGRYYFSVDCEGHVDDERVGEAMMGLYRICAEVRYKGSYPRHDNLPPVTRVGTGNSDFVSARRWLNDVRGLGQ